MEKNKTYDLARPSEKFLTKFSRLSVLLRWAEELKRMHDQECASNFWTMLGRAVMVVHPKQSERRRCVELVADEAGLDLIEMEGSKFLELVLSGQTPSIEKPTLFHLEQGAWSRKCAEGEVVEPDVLELRKVLPTYLQGLDHSCKLVFVTTGCGYDELDSSLRTAGAIDRRFIISKPTLSQTGDEFLDLIGRSLCGTSLLENSGKVGKLIFEEFDDERRQGLVALAMQRVAYKEKRNVEFRDLVHVAIHGSGESLPEPEMDSTMLHRVAVHEAGHALVCYIDSNGLNIPDYVSVLPGHHFRGVVADSYGYMEGLHGKYTYEDSRHKIRSTLAGRAAEAVVFGTTKIGPFGARADLLNASTWAKELMGVCGIPYDIDESESIGGNLLVTDEEPSTSEQSHVEMLARKYLHHQFKKVTEIINKNRHLLDDMVSRLMLQPVLFQENIQEVFCVKE